MPTLTKPQPAEQLMRSTGGSWAGPVAGVAFAGTGLTLAPLTPMPGPVQALSLGLGGAALIGGVIESRRAAREEVLRVLAQTLAGQIGHPAVTQLHARRWTQHWAGAPSSLRILYDPQAPSDDQDWAQKIRKALYKRTRREYEVVGHDPIKRLLKLKVLPVRPVPEDAPVPELARRAEQVVTHLLGTDAKLEATWDQRDLVALSVHHTQGVRISPNHLLRLKIERTIGTMLPGRWRARWDLEGDNVRFELRPEIPDSLTRDLSEPVGDAIRLLPCGRDEDGRECVWDLRSSAGTPHFMATGSTGAGKTGQMRTLAVEICRRHWRLRIADPKRVEFVGMKGWPNVEIVATSVPAMVATIHRTYVDMERRYQLIETGQAVEGDFEPLFLMLDEYRYFYAKVNAWYQDVKPTGGSKICPIFDEVFQIAMLGRTADVHLILGTQRPDASWLGGDVRDQFGARASMGRISPDGAKMMWDSYHVGTTVPRRKPGRGTIIGLDDAPVEYQAYWTPNPTKATEQEFELLAGLKPATATWERHVVLPLPVLDENDCPIPDKGRYVEYLLAPYEPAAEHPDIVEHVPEPLAAGAHLEPDVEGHEQLEREELPAYEELEDQYGPTAAVRAASLEGTSGHLVQIDAAADLWAVVDTAERDATDDDAIAICWRSDEDGDDYGLLVLDGDELIAVRAPLETDPQERA